MRHLKCSSCGAEFPVGAMFRLDRAAVCRACGDRLLQDAKAKKHKFQVARLLDPTICARCKVDNGDTELPLIGGTPICNSCAPALYAHPFPAWLKAGFAALVALLAVALWRDAPYFKAGRALVLARRAMDRRDYGTASSHFDAVLPVHPTDQAVVLLGAKAHLMTGDPAGAQAFLDLRSEFKKDDLFTEVNALWDHAGHAFKKGEQAGKLAEAHRYADAARLLNEAAHEYPQSVPLAVSALMMNGTAAFYRKDYDALVTTGRQAVALAPDNPGVTASLASALACKYAVTGDTAFRAEAERLIDQVQTLAHKSPESQASLDEYIERIRYRLRTRDIIDTDEYKRRFQRGGTEAS